jgi:hypothetical protein
MTVQQGKIIQGAGKTFPVPGKMTEKGEKMTE